MENTQISLRPFELSDVDDFMAWASDEKAARFCHWEPYKSKEDLLNYMQKSVLPHPWFRAICLENRPIGMILVYPGTDSDRCRGELGFLLGSKHWGRGIATQAVKTVLDTIFVDLPHLERLQALTSVDNPASQRVLEKAGFLREGILRKYCLLKGKATDTVVYSFLSTDRVRV
ncbi:hypothetical protein ACLOJK_005724 [Asimina triloba]